MSQILDGKIVATALKDKLAAKVRELSGQGKPAGLAVVLVGDDPASAIYAGRLEKLGAGLGIETAVHRLPAAAGETEVLALIDRLNQDGRVQGILPMMPLPAHISADRIAAAVLPAKDVDAIHPLNTGLVAMGKSRWAPCTPRAVMAILDYYQIPLAGSRAVIIGRSNVVGKPLFHLLLAKDATVTLCHSKTRDIEEVVKQADLVVAAVGKPHFVTASMLKTGAVVIDVGINELNGKIVGDVDYAAALPLAAAITPVPGGVGAVSTVMVMETVLRNYLEEVT